MRKRYQVFVSSTFRNLIEEREAVMRTLLELNFFPAGMEIFPAADDNQIKYIKQIIDDSDYYVIVVAGKYGSLTSKGISYTEMEFDYALQKKKPILAFLHGNLDELPGIKIEKEQKQKKLLENFRKKIESGRLVKFWLNKDELATKVSTTLNHVVQSHPAVGWSRETSNILIEGSDNNKLYIPTRVFEPTTTSSIDFNHDLTLELRKSRSYFFRGISGKRCAVRVKHLKHNPNDLHMKFIMPHPLADDTILLDRISHRMRAKNKFDFDHELNKIKYDIPMSIVSLWNIRNHFQSCMIVFQKDTSISRIEIFDHSVYISLYDSNLMDRKYNPPIIKFSEGSLFYEVYRKEAYREFERSGTDNNKIEINRKYTKQNLIDDFYKFGLGNLTDNKILEYSTSFNKFEIEFLKESRINCI